MHGFLLRGLVAAALAVVTIAVPVASVHACSCMGFTTADAVEAADLAFIGTVAATAPGGQDPMMGVPVVRYAFDVERASQEIGPVVEVSAHDDGGGASCGFTFAVGQRWFVAAMSEGGGLRSNLCSGNVMLADIGDADMAELIELLPEQPVAATDAATDAPPTAPPASPADANVATPIAAALLIGLAAAAALGVVLLMAFRRRRPS